MVVGDEQPGSWDVVTSEDRGAAAVLYLQNVMGVEGNKEAATEMWKGMDDSERLSLVATHKHLCRSTLVNFLEVGVETKFVEVLNGTEENRVNWGKFMLCRFTPEEWQQKSTVDYHLLIGSRGWTPQHLLVIDLQTGEGAIFRPATGGSPSYDLNRKHKIWVCPMFEPFLCWLYEQDLSDLSALPGLVELPTAIGSLFGYRRLGDQTTL